MWLAREELGLVGLVKLGRVELGVFGLGQVESGLFGLVRAGASLYQKPP